VQALEPESVPLREALGRVLAEDVSSPVALPPWDNASMDGYAVRASDVRGAAPGAPVRLRVVRTVSAGAPAGPPLDPGGGQAVRIMTGAPVPAGADSVIRLEDTDGAPHGGMVEIRSDRDAGRNVRPQGEDVSRGAVVAVRGTELGPAHLGLIASVGRSAVAVFRRPRVAILASGDELVDVDHFDEVVAGRRIVSSNSYSLDAAVRAAGGVPVPLGTVGDDPGLMRDRLAGCNSDLLLTSGGVSVGAHDHTKAVLRELGVRLVFWRVRIRPGAPVGFGKLGAIAWLGLPGNPVSALVTFELFARPVIRRLQGHRAIYRRAIRVTLSEPVSISAPLTHFLRAVVEPVPDGYVARLTGPQGSGLLSSMAAANALLVVPPDRARVEAGEALEALLLHDGPQHTDTLPAVMGLTA
jgi:molybdopterin molybdotransferase